MILYIWEPHKDMKLKGSQAIEAYIHPELKNRIEARVAKGEEGSSQEDEKNRCLVIRCLPRHADEAFRLKKKSYLW